MDQPLKFGFFSIEGIASFHEFLQEVLLRETRGFDSSCLENLHGIRYHYRHLQIVGLAGIAMRMEPDAQDEFPTSTRR